MSVKLHITYDGNVPGLAEHKLSVAEFGSAINALLTALRRIASGLVSEATGESYGSRGGSYAARVRKLDIQLSQITKGSIGIDFDVSINTPPGYTLDMFSDNYLEVMAGKQLIEAIEMEGNGKPRNALVRKYLSSLPVGLTKQKYRLSKSGAHVADVELNNLNLIEDEKPMPSLIEVTGEIIGVGFELGYEFVKIKGDEQAYSLLCDLEQLDNALNLRGCVVTALAVRSCGKRRLLRLGRAENARLKISEQDIDKYIFEKWSDLLEKLAQ